MMATGSPFPPVESNGIKKEIGTLTLLISTTYTRFCLTNSRIAECNNSTVFPGIGLGAVLSRTSRVSVKMLVAASRALAEKAPALEDDTKPLLPDVEEVRELSVNIAKAVIQTAVEEGLAQEEGIPEDEAELEEWIRVQMWDPAYRALKKV